LRLGFCFLLGYGFCRLADEGARAPGFDGGAEFGMFDRVLAGVVGDFAHHRLLADPVMDVVAIGARLRDARQVYENTRVAGIQ
jgi:hypothetical protein